MEPKQQLANLMDAFAAAKASENELLQRLVLQQVNMFFSTHEITPIATKSPAPEPTPSQPEVSSWN